MTTPTYADRVQETFTTTGTGPVSLAGAITGYQSFSAVMANSGTCYYCMTDGTNWEVGLGTYTTAGNTLTRTTVLASSNANAAVDWAAGTKSVWLDLAASAIANLTAPPAATAGSLGLVQPDGAIITVAAGAITVAKASPSAFGVVEVDGTTVLASSGVISVPTATSGALGLAKPDNSTVTISGGVLSAVGTSVVTALGIGSIVLAVPPLDGSGHFPSLGAGGTIAGSSLQTMTVDNNGLNLAKTSFDTLSGTWQVLQRMDLTRACILWQRIA